MKDQALMKKIEERGAIYFKGDYMYTKRICEGCKEDFVLKEHDNPMYDGPRQIEFPHVCDDCL